MLSSNDNIVNELLDLKIAQIEAFDRDITSGKAREYYESSEVTRATVFRNKLSGKVGNFIQNFDVEITVHGNEFVCSCACNNNRQTCKHAVALLYSWVFDGDDFLNVAHVLEEINKLDKSRLMDIIKNMIRYNPNLVDIFLAKNKLDWDEIDTDPLV